MGEGRRFRPEIPLRGGVARVAALAAALALAAAAAGPWAGAALAEGVLGASDGTGASSLVQGTDGSAGVTPASSAGGASLLAANDPTTLVVGGTTVVANGTVGDTTSGEGWSYANGVLKLTSATITGTSSSDYGAAIYAAGDLTIELEGSSSATGAVHSSDMPFSGLYVSGTLTISGEGSLTVNAVESTNSSKNNYGIYAVTYIQNGGSITSKSGTGAASRGVYAYSGVTVNGGSLTATGGTATGGTATGGSIYDSSGIYVTGPITVGSATVTAAGGSGTNSYGIYSSTDTNSLTVTGGKVTATGSSSAIYIETYLPLNSSANNHVSVTVSNSGSITAQGGAGIVLKSSQMGGSTGTGSMTVESGSTLLANSVTVNNSPLAPTGEGSWLIYGQSGQTSPMQGNVTLPDDLTIDDGNTFTIPAGSTLNLGGHTLTNNGTLTIADQSSLTGEGSLAGSGTFTLTNPDPVISGGDDLTYDGTDQFGQFSLTAPTGTVEVMGKSFTISDSPSTDGWTLEKQEIKDAGTYTVTASNGTSTIEKEVTVKPATISIASATVQDKIYDGNQDAAVESVTFTGLVNGESLTSGTDYTATAAFADKSAGENKTANVTVTLADTVKNYTLASGGNTTTATASIEPLRVELSWDYTEPFTYDGTEHSVAASIGNTVNGDTISLSYGSSTTTATAAGDYTATVSGLTGDDADNYTLDGCDNTTLAWSIAKADPNVTAPAANSLTYTGQAQALVTAGNAEGGTLQYSTEATGTYNTAIPTGTAAGNYSVWYKVLGDSNHSDTEPVCVNVTIREATIVGATVGLSATEFTYNGSQQKPAVTVTLGENTLTENTDYTVTFGGNSTDAGTYTVTVTGAGNYTGTATKTYAITAATPTLTWSEASQTRTYTGGQAAITAPTVTLVNGEIYNGTFSYQYKTSDGSEYTDGLPTDAGTYTVKASIAAQGNYTAATTSSEMTLTIEKAAADVTAPTAAADLTYDGQPQALVAAGTASGGTMVYSLTESGDYTDAIPTGTNAGEYTVYYYVKGDKNHNDTEPAEVEVTISPLAVTLSWGTTEFTYDGTEHSVAATATNAVGDDEVEPTCDGTTSATNAGDYAATVSGLTGADAVNYTLEGAGSTSQEWSIAPAKAIVTVKDRKAWVGDAVPTDFGADDYVVTGLLGEDELSTQPTLRVEKNDDLVREGRLVAAGTLRIVADGAKADNYEIEYVCGTLTVASRPAPTPDPDPDESETVTNPDGSVTTTVTRPDGSSTATTSTGGGTEAVVERSGSGEVVSVSASVSEADAAAGAVALPVPGGLATGQEVSVSVPEGGAAVVVPVSGGASPSAVLALVGEGGELTVLPKTASAEGGLEVALASDAVLAVVDDAPSFPDVSGDEWYAAEVAPFVSSRGILTGVVTEGGATEFRGDLGTDRAMFVTMLHRLELEPDSAGATFPDVSGDEWYAAAAAWGDGCGIVSGYEDGTGSFGGADPVTREQMAVFMFRYAQWLGLDTSARAGLDFPDGASVSSWAEEAMSWAVAEGLFTGDDGTGSLRPADGATRAEAAAVIMRLVNGVLA